MRPLRPRRNPEQRKALPTAIALFVATSAVVWIAKIHALYSSHDVWSDFGPAYVAAVAAVASWREILVVGALCLLHFLGRRVSLASATAGSLLSGAALVALAFVALVNFVNAELLARLGAPLTVPLIHYSDVLASEHGRGALWSWAGRETVVLGLGLAAAAAASFFAARRLARRFERLVLIALLLGTCALVAAGITRRPVPDNFAESGSLAFLASAASGNADLLDGREPVPPPFAATRIEPGLPRPQAPIRNVILIVVEAGAARYLDLYGGTYNVTPHLKARESGLAFARNAYAQSTSSTAAMRTILFSRYPSPRGAADEAEAPPLPAFLARSGMRTALFHSSDTRFGGARDFLGGSGFGTVRDYRHRHCGGDVLEDRYSSLGNPDRCTFDDMARWIGQQPQAPFFAMLWTFQTHYPYFTSADRPITLEPDAAPTERARESLKRYLGALSETDALIERLIRQLERSGRQSDTLILVTSDHGQAFGQRGAYGNGTSVYEESVRIPLILINPSLPRTPPFARLTGQIDIAPTVADALGLRAPGGWHGASLFAPALERPVHFANMTADRVLGYRFRDRKVIANFVRGTTQVYDLAADPAEQSDLAPRMSEQALRRERDWLATWATRGDLGPTASPRAQ